MSIPTPERMSIPVQQGMRLTHNNGMCYDIILNVTMMSQNSNLYANSKTLKGRTGMKGRKTLWAVDHIGICNESSFPQRLQRINSE